MSQGEKRPRGRPPGSQKKKKDSDSQRPDLSSNLTLGLCSSLPRSDDPPASVNENNGDTTGNPSDNLNSAIERIFRELNTIRSEFQRAFETQEAALNDLKEQNVDLRKTCERFEARITDLEASKDLQATLLNKQERFSRRNNVRIVGIKTEDSEDCIKIVKDVLSKVGIPDCRVERAHRDGRVVTGRDRHILAKLSFYQDKLTARRNQRHALQNEDYFIIDDLTRDDLEEKRKWQKKVSELYQSGTKLHFSGGRWRLSNGKPYNFH